MTISDPQGGQRRELVARRAGIGHERPDPAGFGDDGVGRGPDLRSVGDHDQPIGTLDRDALDLRLAVVELGEAPAGAEPGGTDDREVEPEPGERRGRDRTRRRSARRGGPSRPG